RLYPFYIIRQKRIDAQTFTWISHEKMDHGRIGSDHHPADRSSTSVRQAVHSFPEHPVDALLKVSCLSFSCRLDPSDHIRAIHPLAVQRCVRLHRTSVYRINELHCHSCCPDVHCRVIFCRKLLSLSSCSSGALLF